MQSPYPIEPMYGHLRQHQIARGHVRMNDKVIQNGAHTCQLMHCLKIKFHAQAGTTPSNQIININSMRDLQYSQTPIH